MTRKNPRHRRFISSLPCCACGAVAPSEAAHVRLSTFEGVTVPEAERGGTGLKPADKWCVPLCHQCHRQQHQDGESRFWDREGINPLAIAAALWANTGNLEACRGIVGRARMGTTL